MVMMMAIVLWGRKTRGLNKRGEERKSQYTISLRLKSFVIFDKGSSGSETRAIGGAGLGLKNGVYFDLVGNYQSLIITRLSAPGGGVLFCFVH